MKKAIWIGAVLIVLGLILLMRQRQQMPQPAANTAAGPMQAVDNFLARNPADPAAGLLRRLSAALKAHPAVQETVLGTAAAWSIEDGVVTPEEAEVLKEAAVLAEKDKLIEQELQTFSAKHPEVTAPTGAAASAVPPVIAPPAAPTPPASPTPAVHAIKTYLQQHPSGRGTASLRRLSAAIQSRPAETQKLAETAARSVADGSISKDEAAMLDEAAGLAERGGLSPREMAEFSKKYQQGMGLSHKPSSAKIEDDAPARALANFTGQRQMIYLFKGTVQCPAKACRNIQVSVRVSAGQWVETRETGIDGQGRYVLQMPVMSALNEKVEWHLEAHDKELRKAEVTGRQTTTSGDRDITVENTLLLNPS